MSKQAGKGKKAPPTITDSRFEAVHRDPRFQHRARKNAPAAKGAGAGAAVDSRFAAGTRFHDRARGRRPDESGTETSSSDDSDSDDSDADLEGIGLGAEAEEVPAGDETRRLAVMNCDFFRLKAVDILFVLQSFLPPGGSIKAVTVYPSNFGLERMSAENRFGPQAVITGHTPAAAAGRGGDDSEDKGGDEEDSDPELRPGQSVVLGEGKGFRKEQLRKYELEKLRYYFAVVDCDSVRTAVALYNETDGLEYEVSSNIMDLRFIPDDTKLENPPRETAVAVPSDYKPPKFATEALQSSSVKLTWEDANPDREVLLKWHNQPEDEINYDDFKAYLAGSSEDESEDEAVAEAARLEAQRLRKALLGDDAGSLPDEDDDGGGAGAGAAVESEDSEGDKKKKRKKKKSKKHKKEKSKKEKKGKKEKKAKKGDDDFVVTLGDVSSSSESEPEGGLSVDEEEDVVGAVQHTFTPGVGESMLEAKRRKDLEASETPFERQRRQQKEKRKARRAARKAAEAAAPAAPEPEPAVPTKSKKQRRREREDRKKRAAAKLEEFEVDVDDERFKSLLVDPKFAINPQDKAFKDTPGMSRIMTERRKRRRT